jgi:hypothetical protein
MSSRFELLLFLWRLYESYPLFSPTVGAEQRFGPQKDRCSCSDLFPSAVNTCICNANNALHSSFFRIRFGFMGNHPFSTRFF